MVERPCFSGVKYMIESQLLDGVTQLACEFIKGCVYTYGTPISFISKNGGPEMGIYFMFA